MRSDQPRKQHGFRAKTFLELSTLLCIFPYPSQAGIQQIAMMMSNRITTGSVQSPYTICASRSTAQHVTAASGPHLHNRCKQRLFSAYTSYNGSRKVQQLVCRSSSTQTQAPTELVDDLLQRIKGSDSGVGLQADEEAGVNGIISQLEEVGKQQEPKPLENSLIFGNFNVAFSSTQQAPKQSTQPAGGAFRSGPGRLVFSTRELCQSIIKPDLATNKVAFALFGFLPGSVGLRGKFTSEGDDQATVKVQFEPPRVSLPGGIDLAVGPTSSVVLTTTYLDARVRLGRGSRGSSFVFTRGGAADHAGMEDIGTAKTTTGGYILLLAFAGGMLALAASLFAFSTVLIKALAAVPGLIGTAVLFALWQNQRFG